MATLGNDLKTLVVGEQAWHSKLNQNTQKFQDYGLIIDLSSQAETASINKGIIIKIDEESGAGLAAGDVVRRTVSGATATNLTVEKYPGTTPTDDGTAGWHPLGVVKEVTSGIAYVITYGVAEIKIIANETCVRGATVHVYNTGVAGQAKDGAIGGGDRPVIGQFLEDVGTTTAGQRVLCFVNIGGEAH